jgi:hypothetical protein
MVDKNDENQQNGIEGRSGVEHLTGAYGLGEHGAEALLLPVVYDKLNSICWEREAQDNLAEANERCALLKLKLLFYDKGKDAFEDALGGFMDGAYTDAHSKAKDADKLFSMSTTHDHKLLCAELQLRSHLANVSTLRDLAYESLLKAVQLTGVA